MWCSFSWCIGSLDVQHDGFMWLMHEKGRGNVFLTLNNGGKYQDEPIICAVTSVWWRIYQHTREQCSWRCPLHFYGEHPSCILLWLLSCTIALGACKIGSCTPELFVNSKYPVLFGSNSEQKISTSCRFVGRGIEYFETWELIGSSSWSWGQIARR